MANARGIDISAFQAMLASADLAGGGQYANVDFILVKATNGLEEIDPHLAGNMSVIRESGKVRGCYHELTTEDPGAQADFFLSATATVLRERTDILAVVASDYSGISGAAVNTFCQRVRAGCPHNPIVVYTDLAVAPNLEGAQGWPLWVADWGVPRPAGFAPWATWHLWQNQGTVAPDRDEFNGDAAQLRAWIDSYQPKPDPPPPPPPPEDDMSLVVPSDAGPVPLLIPFGTGQIRLLCAGATDAAPLKAWFTFLNEGADAQKESLSWGTGDNTVTVKRQHDQARIDFTEGHGPLVAVCFDPREPK